MTWQFFKAHPGMGLEAQHLLRLPVHSGGQGAGTCPAITLKRDPMDDRWVAWILETSGLSARAVYFASALTVVEAKDAAERAARDAGWRW